jgi:hypothetical protein
MPAPQTAGQVFTCARCGHGPMNVFEAVTHETNVHGVQDTTEKD